MSALPITGVGSEARVQLVKAQSSLNNYDSLLPQALKELEAQKEGHRLQALVQDVISILTSTPSNPGEKQ